MKVVVFTKEYPPNVYGGVGTHLKYLTRELSKLIEVEVRYFGDRDERISQNLTVRGFKPSAIGKKTNPQFSPVLEALSVNLQMVAEPIDADILHAHTWYTLMAGFWAKKLYGGPLVATVHSLEPLRPWKEEELGSAYRMSNWMEKIGLEGCDKIIAVSGETKKDILNHFQTNEGRVEIIHNGVDLSRYRFSSSRKSLYRLGITRRYVLFVGRITRQKGIFTLIDAADKLPEDVQVVLVAAAPDTKEIEEELREKVSRRKNRIIWINRKLEEEDLVELYSNAEVFCCPSIYEPFGISNLEAMACESPVVASAVGGIKEVVVPEETGILVEPGDSNKLAEALGRILCDKNLAQIFGKNGRKRVEKYFSWKAIARQTVKLYEHCLSEMQNEAR